MLRVPALDVRLPLALTTLRPGPQAETDELQTLNDSRTPSRLRRQIRPPANGPTWSLKLWLIGWWIPSRGRSCARDILTRS
ncbi:hypothetical protein TSAR_005104 [Trichomalopsis sarcophagae]|uniref:Uncharacterized protein n=1 Tax=Trichomalopsis sarcophagae TaxID=543379 RepID=A0A232FLX4_9HYME|nr:hypothetical protein TSAR_005104 [Trichomalopsis sarcophagae]